MSSVASTRPAPAPASTAPTSSTTAPSPLGYSAAPSQSEVRAGDGLLYQGMEGPAVSQLQQSLKAEGFDVAVDGRFGPGTEAAVRSYQARNNLRSDGLVGSNTLGNLTGGGSMQRVGGRNPTPGSRPALAAPSSPAAPAATPAAAPTLRAGQLALSNPAPRPTGSSLASRAWEGATGAAQQAGQTVQQTGAALQQGVQDAAAGASQRAQAAASAVQSRVGAAQAWAQKQIQSALPAAEKPVKTEPAKTEPTKVEAPSSEASTPNPVRAQELARVDTSAMSEAEKYDHYQALAEAGGGRFDASAGARNIVGVRTPDSIYAGGTSGGKHTGTYNDRVAVLWQDKDGTKHVNETKANTEPAEKWVDSDSRDVDGDGTKEAGRLPPGFYEYKVDERRGSHAGEPALRPVRSQDVERDMNHDGVFNDNRLSDSGDSILFHNGKGNNSTGSAGCQTIPKDNWNDFWNSVTPATNDQSIGYTLIQVD